MASLATILTSVAKLIGASDKAYQIVNGPASGPGSEVATASGVVPTMAKWQADALSVEFLLALLVEASLEVAAIGLTDSTGTAPKPGQLTLNGKGDVVVGNGPGPDGESNAEDLPHLVSSRESTNFSAYVPHTLMNNTSYTRVLLEIPLTAAEVAHGKFLNLFGTLQASWPNVGNKPVDGTYLVLCAEGEDPSVSGYYFNIAEGVTTEERSFNMCFVFNVATGTWTIVDVFGDRARCLIKKNATGTITHAHGWLTTIGDFGPSAAITGPANAPAKLQLHLFTLDSSNTVTAPLLIAGSLSAISQ